MKRRLWALLTVAAVLLSGCWSRREINDLGAVIAIGVDRTETGKLALTLAIAQPGAASGGKGQQQGAARRTRALLYREAETIAEAVRLAELVSPRRIALDHTQILLMGERLAREGVNAMFDFLMRSPQIRLSTRMVVVRGATPAEVMEMDPLMRTTQAEALRELESSRVGLGVTLKEFFVARTMPHTSAIVSTIAIHPHVTSETGAPENELVLDGAAVFQRDRAVRFLDQNEVRTAIWLLRNARDTVVTAPCPGGRPGGLSVKVNRAVRNVEPLWDGRHLAFRVDLRGNSRITDMHCQIALESPAQLRELEDAVSGELKRRTESVIRSLQAAGTDPFGFGEQVRAKLPAVWQRVGGEQWMKAWAAVPVTVDANLRIVHMNMTTSPPVLEDAPDKR